MRWHYALAPVLLGLVGGASARIVADRVPRFDEAAIEWRLGALDETVFQKTADIDAILALEPPGWLSSTEAWVEFGRSIREIDTGGRYEALQITPVLGWYAYLARERPEALYRLYDEGVVTGDHLGHLLSVGMASDWYEHVDDVDGLLLTQPPAVASLANARGVDYARRRTADAFFAQSQRDIRLDLECLFFALPAMTDSEVAQVVPRLQSSRYQLDPRFLRRLLQNERLRGEEQQILSLIVEHAYPSRSMSSYLVDGAILGSTQYVREMISDASDNAGQPTNFYCAACGLALGSDGLLGSPLIEAVERGQVLDVSGNEAGISISRAGTRE